MPRQIENWTKLKILNHLEKMVQYLKCFLSIRCTHFAFFSSCCHSRNDCQGIIAVLFTNEVETTQEKQPSCQYHGQNAQTLLCPDTKGIDPPSTATNSRKEKEWEDEEGLTLGEAGLPAQLRCKRTLLAGVWLFLKVPFALFWRTVSYKWDETKLVDKTRVQVDPSSSSLEPTLEKLENELVLSQRSVRTCTVTVAWRRFLVWEQTHQHHKCVPGAHEIRKIAMILEPKVD